jgi:hypothetical protein
MSDERNRYRVIRLVLIAAVGVFLTAGLGLMVLFPHQIETAENHYDLPTTYQVLFELSSVARAYWSWLPLALGVIGIILAFMPGGRPNLSSPRLKKWVLTILLSTIIVSIFGLVEQINRVDQGVYAMHYLERNADLVASLNKEGSTAEPHFHDLWIGPLRIVVKANTAGDYHRIEEILRKLTLVRGVSWQLECDNMPTKVYSGGWGLAFPEVIF